MVTIFVPIFVIFCEFLRNKFCGMDQGHVKMCYIEKYTLKRNEFIRLYFQSYSIERKLRVLCCFYEINFLQNSLLVLFFINKSLPTLLLNRSVLCVH